MNKVFSFIILFVISIGILTGCQTERIDITLGMPPVKAQAYDSVEPVEKLVIIKECMNTHCVGSIGAYSVGVLGIENKEVSLLINGYQGDPLSIGDYAIEGFYVSEVFTDTFCMEKRILSMVSE